jgi:hypothetical protein
MKKQFFRSLSHKLAASILISLSAAAFAQAVPGTPAPTQQQPRRGAGFGISLDLGALIKAVSDAVIPSYSSPDTSDLSQYEPRQVILAWLPANEAQASTAIQASGGNTTALTNLPNLGIGIAVLEFAGQLSKQPCPDHQPPRARLSDATDRRAKQRAPICPRNDQGARRCAPPEYQYQRWHH